MKYTTSAGSIGGRAALVAVGAAASQAKIEGTLKIKLRKDSHIKRKVQEAIRSTPVLKQAGSNHHIFPYLLPHWHSFLSSPLCVAGLRVAHGK